MHKTPLEITRHIHENFWIVLSFALARPVAAAILDKRFMGEWKYLAKTIYERGELRADRALLEMATQLRVLDDQQDLSSVFKAAGMPPLGVVNLRNGKTQKLNFRQMTNKVIHGDIFEWEIDNTDEPKIVVISNQSQDWSSAEINVVALMGCLGQIMH